MRRVVRLLCAQCAGRTRRNISLIAATAANRSASWLVPVFAKACWRWLRAVVNATSMLSASRCVKRKGRRNDSGVGSAVWSGSLTKRHHRRNGFECNSIVDSDDSPDQRQQCGAGCAAFVGVQARLSKKAAIAGARNEGYVLLTSSQKGPGPATLGYSARYRRAPSGHGAVLRPRWFDCTLCPDGS